MPRKRFRRKPRRGWTDGHRRQLMFGFDHLGCAWGDAVKRPYAAAPEAVEREMKTAWGELGDEITAAAVHETPGTRPWAWWHFSAPEPRDESVPEAVQLNRLGVLQPHEIVALRDAEERLRLSQDFALRHGTPPRRWFHLPLPTQNARERHRLETGRTDQPATPPEPPRRTEAV